MDWEEVALIGRHKVSERPAGLVSLGRVGASACCYLGCDLATALVRALTYLAEETGVGDCS